MNAEGFITHGPYFAGSHRKNEQRTASLLCLSVPLYPFVKTVHINVAQLFCREWGLLYRLTELSVALKQNCKTLFTESMGIF